jgi:hypothetical protein
MNNSNIAIQLTNSFTSAQDSEHPYLLDSSTPALDHITHATLKPAQQVKKRYVTGDEVGEWERRAIETNPTWGNHYSSRYDLQRILTESLGLYAFTTENIMEYLPMLKAEGKRCLTVAASGDHVINLLMAGAREVVCFDTVEAAGEITALKMQALADLKWKSAKHFRSELWNEVSKPIPYAHLQDRATDPLYDRGRPTFKTVIEQLDLEHAFKMFQTAGRNAYITDDTLFGKAQRACKQALEDGRVSFIVADIRELPFLELGCFDAIVLSNILQAKWQRMTPPQAISREPTNWKGQRRFREPKARLKGLIDTMIWPVAEMLNPDGIMMASYTYACSSDRTDSLKSKRSRVEAFTPPSGFTTEERDWDVVNGEASGRDVGVMIQRDAVS